MRNPIYARNRKWLDTKAAEYPFAVERSNIVKAPAADRHGENMSAGVRDGVREFRFKTQAALDAFMAEHP